mmetsp:Transcript_364/g.1123  ORF Transcript_364/g.1123 Transcript_364/m.1123 type:complete len:413 (-) Transcript_364:69-1307(-)|eukprot:CAMPEP_0117660274 /NCGR_PEP_ID=MMETSP0804-20121206/6883_1 /TAXON_ID=1074897 /ORGANISM="Tetraselmis astigmatica, Strain CCMP880" /LENGTH=412 /DNA_ID=CAMNT_0005466997 /DNA_START=223 /DNA_END=1461 /DNA_ORIENTATION=-
MALRSGYLLRCHRVLTRRRHLGTQLPPSLPPPGHGNVGGLNRLRKSMVECMVDESRPALPANELASAARQGAYLVTHASEISPQKLRRRAHLMWEEGSPRTVLLVKKKNSEKAAEKLREMAQWLQESGLNVVVEEKVQKLEFPELQPYRATSADCAAVDLCISLGGDGTFLHMASLFTCDDPMPPAVSFAMGTLGFLTPFDVADFKNTLSRVLAANEANPVFCTLRTRKTCKVYRPDGHLASTHHVLNECLVDRGAFPSMISVECFVDGEHVTTVKADGLIIATPSGSTAYSLSVGGPVVSPSVPCSLVTPIAPHSLSFRPLVVPESSDILIHIPDQSRSPVRASFDGRSSMTLQPGASIQCQTSLCPMPVVNLGKLDHDWYESITQKLKWNEPIVIHQNGEKPEMPRLIDT